MPDKDKMSVEEILAACRKLDGGGDASASQPSAAEEPPAPAANPAAEPPAGKKPSEMSVEEILAAARAEKAGGSEASSSDSSEASAPTSATAPAAPKKKPSEMSVEEILAAARAEKSRPATPAKPAAKPKPAASAKPAAKSSPKPAAGGKKPSGPLDTASILAAARKSSKRGPVSKEEAARTAAPAAAKAGSRVPPMPSKPDFLRPAAKPKPAESRRGFFGSLIGIVFGSAMAVGFVSLAVTQLLWLLGFARFMFPNILIEPPSKFKVGFPDVIGPGQVVTKFKAQFGVWIVRNEYEGVDQIYALRSVCTHLGCTPNWLEAEQKFKCPCHGSGFYKNGINFEGPAPRPLERYAITVADDGQLEVDKSRKFQQELGQWNDPQSFVPV